MNGRFKCSAILALISIAPLFLFTMYLYERNTRKVHLETPNILRKNTSAMIHEMDSLLDQFRKSSLSIALQLESSALPLSQNLESNKFEDVRRILTDLIDDSMMIAGARVVFPADSERYIELGKATIPEETIFQMTDERDVISLVRLSNGEMSIISAVDIFSNGNRHTRIEFQLDTELLLSALSDARIFLESKIMIWSSDSIQGVYINSEEERHSLDIKKIRDIFRSNSRSYSSLDSSYFSTVPSEKHQFIMTVTVAKDVAMEFSRQYEMSHAFLLLVHFLVVFLTVYLLFGSSWLRSKILPSLSINQPDETTLENGKNEAFIPLKEESRIHDQLVDEELDNSNHSCPAVAKKLEISPEDQGVFEAKISALRADLAASKLNLSTTLDSAPNAILTVDAEGRIIQANRELERMFGYTKEEFFKMNVDELVPAGFRGHHKNHRDSYLKAPTDRTMGQGRDLYAQAKGGTEFPVEVGIAPILGGLVQKVMCSIVDVTERKATAKKLILINESLREKSGEIEQFVYTVSHDLKAPLVTAMGFLTYLEKDLSSGRYEKAQDSLQRIFKAAKKMDMLVEDLLQFSRVGYVKLEKRDVDLNTMIESVLSQFKSELEKEGVKVELQKNIGSMYCDEFRLIQVFDNLIGNAIKYGSPEGGVIRIGRADTQTGMIRIFVADNGQGIHSDYQEKVFELFQRLESSKSGTGVGLSIVKKIVELHHGSVSIESTVGEGSTFWISMPVSSTQLKCEEID